MIQPPIQLHVTVVWQDAMEMLALLSVQASQTVAREWANLPLILPPIQLHVTAWQDAMEMTVLLSVQASQTVVREWENHGLRTPREEMVFTARPKIHSHSQIFRYGSSIFCLPHRPNFSDIFDFCLHWVSVVGG